MYLQRTIIAASLFSLGFLAQAATPSTGEFPSDVTLTATQHEQIAREAGSRGRGKDDKAGHGHADESALDQIAREAESRGRGRGRDDKAGHGHADESNLDQIAREAGSRGRGKDDKAGHGNADESVFDQIAREAGSRGRGKDDKAGHGHVDESNQQPLTTA